MYPTYYVFYSQPNLFIIQETHYLLRYAIKAMSKDALEINSQAAHVCVEDNVKNITYINSSKILETIHNVINAAGFNNVIQLPETSFKVD